MQAGGCCSGTAGRSGLGPGGREVQSETAGGSWNESVSCPDWVAGVLPAPFCSVPTWGHRGFLTQCLVASVAIEIQNGEVGGCYDINAEKSRKVPLSLTVLVGEERHLEASRVLNGALHLPLGLSSPVARAAHGMASHPSHAPGLV